MATTPITPLPTMDEDEEDSFGDEEAELSLRAGDVVRTSLQNGKLAVVRYVGIVDGLSKDSRDTMLGLEIILKQGERGKGHEGVFDDIPYYQTKIPRTGVFLSPNEVNKLNPEELVKMLQQREDENANLINRVKIQEKKARRGVGGSRSPSLTPKPDNSSVENREELMRLRRDNANLEEELDRIKRFKKPTATFEGELRQTEAKLARAKAQIKQLSQNERRKFGDFSADIDRLRQQNTHLKHQNEKLKRDRLTLRQEKSELEKQLQANRSKLSGRRSRSNSKNIDHLEAQVAVLRSEVAVTKARERDQQAENEKLAQQLTRVGDRRSRKANQRAIAASQQFEVEKQKLTEDLRNLRMENRRLKRERDEIEDISRRAKARQRKQLVHARRERDEAHRDAQRRRRNATIDNSDALKVQLNNVQTRLSKKDQNLTSRIAQIQRLSERIHDLEGRLGDVNRRASVTNQVDHEMLQEYSTIEKAFDDVVSQLDDQAVELHSRGLAVDSEAKEAKSLAEIEELTTKLQQAREENRALEEQIVDLKRQLVLSADERVEELQDEILVLNKRRAGSDALGEEKLELEYTGDNHISSLLDKDGALTPEEAEEMRKHLIVLRQRFGKLIEAEREQAPEKFRAAKLELQHLNERQPDFDAGIKGALSNARDLKEQNQELNSFRIIAETDAQNDPDLIDPEEVERRRINAQVLRDEADTLLERTDDFLTEAERRHDQARMLNLQVHHAINTLTIGAEEGDDVVSDLSELAEETQAMEDSAAEALLECRETRMILIHSSINAADTENSLLTMQLSQNSGGGLNEEDVFDVVMNKRIESMNLVTETPAIHLSGLTEYDSPELIREAIDTIQTFKKDVEKLWDSSYELDDDEYQRKMADLGTLENAYEEYAAAQEGRLPPLPEGRSMFPEQVPTPFGLQVLQTLEDAFNEFENDRIIQHQMYEFKKDVDNAKETLDSLESKLDDPMFAPRLHFHEEDDHKPRGYFEALTPIDKELADVRQYMQFKRKGMEYKQYRSLPTQQRRLDRIEEILTSFETVPNEMVRAQSAEYEARLQEGRMSIEQDATALDQRSAEVEEVLERANQMIKKRMALEQTQRSAPVFDATDVFGDSPQFTLEDLQLQLNSLQVALKVNNDFVLKAGDDLADLGEDIDKYEDEVHNREMDGGRASEIHEELDTFHEVLNIHARSLNDKEKETLSHGQSLLEISNELQKHDTLAKLNARDDAKDDEDQIEPLMESLADVRELYEVNQNGLNRNQLSAIESDGRVYSLKQILRDSFNAPNPPDEQALQEHRMLHVKKYNQPIAKDLSTLTPYDSEEDLRNAIARIDATRAFLDPNVADGLTGDLDRHLNESINELEDLRTYYSKVMAAKLQGDDFNPDNFVLEEKFTPVAREEAARTDQNSTVDEIQQAEDRVARQVEHFKDVRQALRSIRELRQLRAAYSSMVGPVGRDPQEKFGKHFQTGIAQVMADVDASDEAKLEKQLVEIDQCRDWLDAKANNDPEKLQSLGAVRSQLHDLSQDDIPLAHEELTQLRDELYKELQARNAEKKLRFMNARLVLHQRRQNVVESGFEDSHRLIAVSGDGVATIDDEKLETDHAKNFANLSSADPVVDLVEEIHRIDEAIDEQRRDVLPDTFELCQTMINQRAADANDGHDLDGIHDINELTPDQKERLGKELEDLRDEYITYYRRRLSPEKQVELLEEQLLLSKREKKRMQEQMDPHGPSAETEVAGIIQPAPIEEFAAVNMSVNRRAPIVPDDDMKMVPPAVPHELEEENRMLSKRLEDLEQQLRDQEEQMAQPTYEVIEEKEHMAGAPRRPSTQSSRHYRGPGFSGESVENPLAFKPLMGEKRSSSRRPSSVFDAQNTHYDEPDIGKTIVRGSFIRKKVYFQVRVPGENEARYVERRLKHFQQLKGILDLYFHSKGETVGVRIPTVIQAPPTALWKSGMLDQAKADLKTFLLDCARISEIRRHQAYRSFVHDNIEEWKKYANALAKK